MPRALSWIGPGLVLLSLAAMPSCVTTPGGGNADAQEDPAPGGVFLPDEPEMIPAPVESEPSRVRNLTPEEYARWETEPARAMGKARVLGRPLLILFTALAWTPSARVLGEEVFLSRSFNELARDHLTLVYLDFPQNASKAPASHQRLKDHYDVRGYPTLVLVDAKGNVIYEKRGYTAGKARDYFEELERAVLAFRTHSPSTVEVPPAP